MSYRYSNNISFSSKGSDAKLTAKQCLLLIFCGSAIGFLNGFLGGGGGMICVPLLENVLKIPSKYSHATAIVIIFPISLISAAVYTFSGVIENIPLLTITFGTVLGGVVGSLFLKVLPSKIIRIIFSLIMLAGGIRLLF